MDDRGARQRLAYVTDLELRLGGGGSYAVNWHAFAELQRRFEVQYSGPIVPQLPILESAISKVRRRILKRPGTYAYFSDSALHDNARRVAEMVESDSEAIVFRSAGRWCKCRPRVPYFIYLDVATHTFFCNTFADQDFFAKDLDRIWRAEAAFLENASGVFFENDWGRRMAIEAYGLKRDHYTVVNRGGVVDPPNADNWDGESHTLVTVSMNFRQKGGDIVADAYRKLKPRFPSLAWKIVGARPDFDIGGVAGVTYEGILHPDVPEDAERLRSILANAFLLLHPTREDTSPLVITEAGYFGCPAISMNAFAIPELVIDGVTGVLLDSPASADSLAESIEALLIDRARYASMRLEARKYAIENFRWEQVGALMCDGINAVIGD